MDDIEFPWAVVYSGNDLLLAYLSTGLWAAAQLGANFCGVRAIVAGIRGPRRLVNALRFATLAGSVEIAGLFAMVLIANPERWSTGAWCLSLVPLLLGTLGIGAALGRGEARDFEEEPTPAGPNARRGATYPAPVDFDRGLSGPRMASSVAASRNPGR